MENRMFGFVLLPDRHVMHKSIKLHGRIEHNKVPMNLDINLPHVTVLQAPISPTFNYSEALDKFRDYAGFNIEPRTRIGDIYYEGKNILLGLENAKWLSTFNQIIVNEVKDSIKQPSLDGEVFISPQHENSFRLTGYRRNLEAYEPHITLAVPEEPVLKAPANELKGEFIRFHTLAYTEHGEHGCINRILASRPLPVSWD